MKRLRTKSSRWWRLQPLRLYRGRWYATLSIGWYWLLAVRFKVSLREYGDWRPYVDVDVTLWRVEISAWLGGFSPVDEDGERRSLGGVAATVNTYGAVQLICRMLGHDPSEPLSSGYVYCERCQDGLVDSGAARLSGVASTPPGPLSRFSAATKRRRSMDVDAAMKRLVVIPDYDPGDGPQPCVHTFRTSAVGLLGAHWPISKAREAMEAHGVDEAGVQASAIGHRLVVVDGTSPVFFEARDA